jgi:hypothetical protein
LQLNGVRFRFLVPPHHQDFKHAEIVLPNGRKDREFNDIVRRNRDGNSAEERGNQYAGNGKMVWHRGPLIGWLLGLFG